MKAQQVATFLSELGIPTGSYTEGNDLEDGQVDINLEVYVQVGTDGDYMVVHRWTAEDEVENYPMRSSIMEVAKDVQKALKARETGYRVVA